MFIVQPPYEEVLVGETNEFVKEIANGFGGSVLVFDGKSRGWGVYYAFSIPSDPDNEKEHACKALQKYFEKKYNTRSSSWNFTASEWEEL